jgi:hypothetical protein
VLFRSRRRASKSGCDWTVRIIVSISAIITLGLISCSVHSRRGSRGVGKLSESGLSRIADTSLDLGKGCGSSILSNNRYGQRSGRQRPSNRGAGNFLELEVEERHRFRNRSDIPVWSEQDSAFAVLGSPLALFPTTANATSPIFWSVWHPKFCDLG